MKWSHLAPAERAELEALIAASNSDAYLADHEWLLLPVCGLLLGIAAIVALWIQSDGTLLQGLALVPALVREVGLSSALMMMRSFGMFVAALAFTAWMIYFIVTNLGRRGSAATSYGCVKVMGRRLKLMRHGEVARIARRVIRTKKSSFTAFELFDRTGRRLTFLVHGTWANAATAAIESARREKIPVTDR